LVRQGIAEAFERESILTYLGYRIRTALGHGREPGPEASCMKLAVAQHMKRSTELALEIQGAAGALVGGVGGEWYQHFLAAPSIRIAGGSDEIQRNVIAERALGLPADVRVDKAVPFSEIPKGGR
jgi:alkylation response protein AidB-like acyl-CoA dehydrogenase